MTRADKEEMGRLRQIIRDQMAVVKQQDEELASFKIKSKNQIAIFRELEKEIGRLRKLDQNYEDSVREDYEHANSKLIAISNILREIK